MISVKEKVFPNLLIIGPYHVNLKVRKPKERLHKLLIKARKFVGRFKTSVQYMTEFTEVGMWFELEKSSTRKLMQLFNL